MNRPPRCPVCRGSITVTPATVVELWHSGAHSVETGRGLEERPRRCLVAACNHCEHVHELTTGVLR